MEAFTRHDLAFLRFMRLVAQFAKTHIDETTNEWRLMAKEEGPHQWK